MKLMHTGNGVIVVAASGIEYEATTGDVIEFVGTDGDYLANNHPEWTRLDDDHAEDQLSHGDDSGEEE